MSEFPACAFYEFDGATVVDYVEGNGPLPTGHCCNARATRFDELMRGWVCDTHARANECLRALLPADAEFAALIANADLDDEALDAILAGNLDEAASRLKAALYAYGLRIEDAADAAIVGHKHKSSASEDVGC